MWLLDAKVVSELRKKQPSKVVLSWISKLPPQSIFMSVVTIGEIQLGIETLRPIDAARAGQIEAWLEQLAASSNVIGLDTATLRMWGKLMHRQNHSLSEDALIAATALTRNLCVVTRNVPDFEHWAVRVHNPFEQA
jgi:predicted nucleic acid-binding protein